MRVAASIALLAAAACAHAQELSLDAGLTRSRVPEDTSFGLGLNYTHPLASHLAASIGYRNEGHIPNHHRDGMAAQLWLLGSAFSPELTFGVGAGPYHYFDTTVAEGRSTLEFNDAHGWGYMYSGTATWRPPNSKWFYELRLEHIETSRNIDTTLLMAGIGYRLDQDSSFRAHSSGHAFAAERNDEVFVGGGQTIVNSFESQSAGAASAAWRHAFGPVLRGSVGWLHEGDARLIRRDGVTTLAWAEPSFGDDRFTLGFSAGGYFSVDRYRPGSKDVLGLVSTTASVRMSDHWVARFMWHRVASRHDRDSDILLLGLGGQF